MRKNYTHITFLLDRSYSMMRQWEDVQRGYEKFVAEHKGVEGKCTFSLIFFDDEYNNDNPFTDVKYLNDKLLVSPRGNTALNDAFGKSILQTGETLAAMNEQDRPAKVLFVIQTDGEENSSSEFSGFQVAELIKDQTDKYNWQFIFLGADEKCLNKAQQDYNLNDAQTSTYSGGDKVAGGMSRKLLSIRRCDVSDFGKCARLTDEEKAKLNID